MEYDTLEVTIGPGNGREYPIAARSLAGEAHAIMQFPLDELALENRLLHLQNALLRSGGQRRRLLSPEQEAVQRFGQELFETLMTGDIRLCYERSTDRAQREGKGLRVQLRIQPPDMATLPWEFMYDAHSAAYLALSPRSPVIRYLNVPQSIEPLKVEPPLRMLGMIANPQGVQRLDTSREKERLERAVDPLRQSGLIELTWAPGETWRDLQRMMRSGQWHMFHFIGHGGFDRLTDEGFIVLSDDQQQPHFLPATQLGELLTGYYPPRLVLLNACDGALGGQQDIFSSTASILIRRGIPAVVAMQYDITDRAAIEFSHAFYEAVATGLSVEAAMAEARKAIWISIPNSFEWGTPVLTTHAPDGILFDIQNQDDERITFQATILSGGKEVETPEYLATSPAEQKPREIETENKGQIFSSERVGEVKADRYIAERTHGSHAQSSQLSTSATTIQIPISMMAKRIFFRQWILANAAGGIGVGVVVNFMNLTMHGTVGGDVGWFVGGFTGGFVSGLAQWLVLRRYIFQSHWWIVVSAISLPISLFVGVAVGKTGGETIGFFVGLFSRWAAQWFILRRYVPRWWIVVSLMHLFTGLLVSVLALAFISSFWEDAISSSIGTWDPIIFPMIGGMSGTIYAAGTKEHLLRLLQHSTSKQH